MASPAVRESAKAKIVDILSEVPRFLPSSFNRMKMWELISTRAKSACNSTQTFGEWWSSIVKRLGLESAFMYKSPANNIVLGLDETDPRDIQDEAWRLLRNEMPLMVALSKQRWEEKKKASQPQMEAFE